MTDHNGARLQPLPGSPAGALEWLWENWGRAYRICVAGREWRAVRRDGTGVPLTAVTAEQLRRDLIADRTAALAGASR
jgi:hypothetical protein